MAATGYSSWADLNSELLVSIAAAAAGEGSSLLHYVCLRGVCAAWRSALAPPYPCLLSLNDDRAHSASVFSFPMQRAFHLDVHHSADISRARIVGSGNGRLAITIDHNKKHYHEGNTYVGFWTARIFLLDPHARDVVELSPTIGPGCECCEYGVRKVVFAPDPDDGTIVAMCGRNRIAYGDGSKSKSDLVWKTVDVVTGVAERVTDLVFDAGGKVYCLNSNGGLHVLSIPQGGQNSQEAPPPEPSVTLLPAYFSPPYDVASTLTSTKHLFFCHGSLYQLWQNGSSTIHTRSGLTMSADEIFVLRYDPRPWPCWNVVKDLECSSVFVGKNSNPAVVRSGTIQGVRRDCVYWMSWQCVPMVCDVDTGTSKPCVLPDGVCKRNCWYFGHDNMTSKQ